MHTMELPPYHPEDVQKPRWKRRLKVALIILGLALALTVIYVFIQLSRLSVNPLDMGPLRGEDRGRVNILVLGIGDPGHAGQKLSDTVMLVSLAPATHQLAYISLPRDLRVDIPGYG